MTEASGEHEVDVFVEEIVGDIIFQTPMGGMGKEGGRRGVGGTGIGDKAGGPSAVASALKHGGNGVALEVHAEGFEGSHGSRRQVGGRAGGVHGEGALGVGFGEAGDPLLGQFFQGSGSAVVGRIGCVTCVLGKKPDLVWPHPVADDKDDVSKLRC